MKGYKVFHKGMVCNGKQYAENTVFEENGADECCQSGVMHFCETPFDCLDHYPLVDDNGEFSEFAEVEPLEDVLSSGNKRATKKLRIGAKLKFGDFVKTAANVIIENTRYDNTEDSIEKKRIGSSGDCAQIGSSGYYARIGSSGDYAQIGSSGDDAQIGSSGQDSVVCCAGHNCTAKAAVGSWITLAEWTYNEGKKRFVPICVKTERVDGERIKADTRYKLKDGEFVEVNEED